MLTRVWPMLKVWRKFNFGPVAFVFSFRRRIPMSRGISLSSLAQASHLGAHSGTELNETRKDTPKRDTARTVMGTAAIVGAGPGLGHALARKLAREGFDLILVSRNPIKNVSLAHELSLFGGKVETVACDVTDETSVLRMFKEIEDASGAPSLVVYALQESSPGHTVEISVPAFESAWRHNCLGAFLIGRSSAKTMTKAGKGSIVFIGSTSSIMGRAGHLNLAVGKFGQRAIAQVLARELWPIGIHVAHIMIDADIRESEGDSHSLPQSCPDEIAESVVTIHRQPRTAWSSELDLRPWNESFWNHC